MSTIRSFILDDQTDDVVALLKSFVEDKRKEATAGTTSESGSVNEIGIVVDNAGYELVSDLVLGHCLLATGNTKGFLRIYYSAYIYMLFTLRRCGRGNISYERAPNIRLRCDHQRCPGDHCSTPELSNEVHSKFR